ncbi:MAG: class I SAM-dependent methyltransferase [Chloroflexi bacterium]|nr:class I SAM-dependent methyltransferase [Chloroflexota bacterium]
MSGEKTALADREARKTAYIERLLPFVPLHRVIARAVECLIISDVERKQPSLDLGCGDGTFAYALGGGFAAGIDADPKIVRWAAQHRSHGSLVVADARALPFRSGAFASVVCNSTLEHIPDQQTVLEETRRVLAPGGAFILTVPSEHFLRFHLGSSLARLARLQPLARLYERWMEYIAKVHHTDAPDIWLERLAAAGFQTQDWRYYFTSGSTKVMDAAQYVSIPAFVTRWLLGRWVVWQGKGRLLPLARWLAPLANEGGAESGAFLFFHCNVRDGLAL